MNANVCVLIKRPETDLRRILLGIWGRLAQHEREQLIAHGRTLLERSIKQQKQ